MLNASSAVVIFVILAAGGFYLFHAETERSRLEQEVAELKSQLRQKEKELEARRRRDNSIEGNTAHFYVFSHLRQEPRLIFGSDEVPVCGLSISLTRLLPEHVADFDDFPLLLGKGGSYAFVMTFTPDAYDDECYFELDASTLAISFHGDNEKVIEQAQSISSILKERYQYVTTTIAGNFTVAAAHDYQFLEVNFDVILTSTTSDHPKARHLRAAFDDSRLEGYSPSKFKTSPKIGADEILQYILEGAQWVSPGVVSRGIGIIKKGLKQRRSDQ